MSFDPVALLQDLIRCPSVTPQDAGALDVLERVLREAGFSVHRLRFSAPGTPEIDNLYARMGTHAPHLTFAGHTDVVPPGDAAQWRFDPFSAELAEGCVWGRGAVDMKGGVAASVAATLQHMAEFGPPNGSISFLITGDEEGPAINGTIKLLDWAVARGEKFDHCILGEPTNPQAMGDMIKIGRRGSLSGEVRVVGQQGHVAYPHLAQNPIPVLMAKLQALIGTPLDQGTAHFDASNLEITSIDVGNGATNIIPAQATAKFNVRFNDLWTDTSLAEEIGARLAGVAGPSELVLAPCNALAFITQPGPFTSLVCRAVEAECARTPVLSTTGGTSDARFIVHACPVVEFGLVGQTMHKIDERASVADLLTLTKIYRRVLTAYFSPGPLL
ncbi:MAG: succinyl-diaminopimelate desuccinylase [Hyphomicrobiales bacterium]|nr:succinyl-diaminopimelate desuccinylase [Hyphomicrobiales bacterium]MDE2113888.1 succinyl-diaminopimelate desuccinylase [Hyphomicrobiales bacterium]